MKIEQHEVYYFPGFSGGIFKGEPKYEREKKIFGFKVHSKNQKFKKLRTDTGIFPGGGATTCYYHIPAPRAP